MDKNLVGRKVAFSHFDRLGYGIVTGFCPFYEDKYQIEQEGDDRKLSFRRDEFALVSPSPEEFYNALTFLYNHPAFVYDPEGLDDHSLDSLCVEVVKVNPETNQREDDESLNTRVEVWLEYGPYMTAEEMVEMGGEDWVCTHWGGVPLASHDINLDCSAPTYEEAIIKLAELVKKWYTDDGKDREYCERCAKEITSSTIVACKGCNGTFCEECGKTAINDWGLCKGEGNCEEFDIFNVQGEEGSTPLR